jgi:glycosyltransferase involved in cell wall biosynthesis
VGRPGATLSAEDVRSANGAPRGAAGARPVWERPLLRARAWGADQVRKSGLLRDGAALAYYARANTGGPLPRRLAALATAARVARHPALRRRALAALAPWGAPDRLHVWRECRVGIARYDAELGPRELVKSLVLKRPGPDGERGVLYVSFELEWARLLHHHDARAILERYVLVGASSSSPPDLSTTLAVASRSHDPFFVQVSNPADVEYYGAFGDAVRPVPLMACDWVHPRYYAPREMRARRWDIAMIAGWARLKNHWMLFRALRRMRRDVRVVLVGQDMEGRGPDDVRAEAAAYGVERQVEFVRNATPDEVSDILCDSRVSVVLSRREGSSVVVAESFFAGAPVVALRGAHIGALRYVNERTGALTRPGSLHRALGAVLDDAARFDPRGWAVEHIASPLAVRRLNEILRQHAADTGAPWTRDIVPMCWRPDPIYTDDADAAAMQPAYDALYAEHGLRFRDHPASGASARGTPDRSAALLGAREEAS